jgi:imidazolonepropionase-like amidohydrolase
MDVSADAYSREPEIEHPVILTSFMRVLLILMSVIAASASTLPKATLVIAAERMLDVDAGAYDSGVVVYVAGDRIERIEHGEAPADAIRVNTLLPGLIDAHVHLAWSGVSGAVAAKKTLAAGFTTVRNLGSDSDADRKLQEQIERGDVAGPRMLISGPGLGGPGGTCPRTFGDAGEVASVEEARMKVRSQVRERGAQLIKICTGGGVVALNDDAQTVELSPQILHALVDEARALGVKVAAHAQGPSAIMNAVEAGVSSIEHGGLIDAETAALMRERNVVLVPTLARLGGVRPDLIEHARLAVKARVPIVLGSDATVMPHGDNAKELLALVDIGLSPIEAVRAATTRAAALLGLSNVGVIRAGAAADLIAVDGDPLMDVGLLARPSLVVARGKIIVDTPAPSRSVIRDGPW